VTAEIIESAAGHASAAAEAAGVRVEATADPARLHAVAELLGHVWGTTPGPSPLTPDVLRAIAHAGGVVHTAHIAASGTAATATRSDAAATAMRAGATGATAARADLVGAAAAIFGPPASRSAYSLIAAARSSDRGVGFALKQAQRAWALGHGVTAIFWTFDPLVSRNAHFNLVKLGAIARQYTVDFYGSLNDDINRDDETDRLTVRWVLAGTRASTAAQGRPLRAGGPHTCGGAPSAPDGGWLTARATGVLWCRVPEDIVALRSRDPGQAVRWRLAVRDVLSRAFAEGLVATAMTRDGWYRLEAG
jgi:predicted GNAT superfamily acetyltransferase